MTNTNQGTIIGELHTTQKEYLTTKSGKQITKYVIIIEQSHDYKGVTYHKKAAIEYIRWNKSEQIEALKPRDSIRCEFKIESREWKDKDGKSRYFTTASGIGDIQVLMPVHQPSQQTSLPIEDNYDDIPF
jgi:hypothetical protein